jgi:hypothetical protein
MSRVLEFVVVVVLESTFKILKSSGKRGKKSAPFERWEDTLSTNLKNHKASTRARVLPVRKVLKKIRRRTNKSKNSF